MFFFCYAQTLGSLIQDSIRERRNENDEGWTCLDSCLAFIRDEYSESNALVAPEYGPLSQRLEGTL